MTIELKELTTCGVSTCGQAIELNFIDGEGTPVCLRMTFGSGQAIAMTLPQLLTEALRKITGSDNARYAFPLGSWWIEANGEKDSLIATFATYDGFQVSFDVPRDACGRLGWAFRHEAAVATSRDDQDWSADSHVDVRLN